jgi:6-phosphofructokinase 2
MMLDMAHITTLTLNPSVDVLTTTAQVMDTHKLRCTAPEYHPGGGGINVARVVHRLGGSVQALWLGGGSTGVQLADMLDAEGVAHRCMATAQATRMGFSVHETQSGRDFRFVMPGPSADPAALRHILKTLSTPNPDCRYWVVSGSLPPDAPPNFYADIAQMAQAQQKKLVLDASGPSLEVPVRSKIGAGDTFVGAFVATLDQMNPDTSPDTLRQALRHAMAASAAALASLGTALCQATDVARLLESVQVISLKD